MTLTPGLRTESLVLALFEALADEYKAAEQEYDRLVDAYRARLRPWPRLGEPIEPQVQISPIVDRLSRAIERFNRFREIFGQPLVYHPWRREAS